jgi:hypothetical protein
MDILYKEVKWNDAVYYTFKHPKNNRRSVELPARKLLLNNINKKKRLIFDKKDKTDIQGLKCIIIGKKILANGRNEKQEHYILVVESTSLGDYEKVGVGSIQKNTHIVYRNKYCHNNGCTFI